MRTHRCLVTAPRRVEFAETDAPTAPGPREILVESEWSVISTGTELANYTGVEPQVFQPGSWCAYPWIPGYGNVGIVRAVGAGVRDLAPGQRVFTFGPHASRFAYPIDRLVAPVPEDVDPALAAASRMAGVALAGPLACDIRSEPWVAVFGLGMVGNLAAQAFRILGARVIGVDRAPERRSLARRCGLDAVVAAEGAAAAVRALTGGAGALIACDATGHSSGTLEALRATADHGQLVVLGTPRAPVTGDLTEVFATIHRRWITVRGALEWSLPTYADAGPGPTLASKQAMIFDWIRRGRLLVGELISHRVDASRIGEAYEGLLATPDTWTGALLDWRAYAAQRPATARAAG